MKQVMVIAKLLMLSERPLYAFRAVDASAKIEA
jgi:hypothetical protein